VQQRADGGPATSYRHERLYQRYSSAAIGGTTVVNRKRRIGLRGLTPAL
jgi:hypothetical protein